MKKKKEVEEQYQRRVERAVVIQLIRRVSRLLERYVDL